ncbi:MAG TPA: hypothetical protein VH374_08820 [Polyangia bacterium]|jgi:hypothetical protein|nr:hypothetical protein [Polyangia bacterium]
MKLHRPGLLALSFLGIFGLGGCDEHACGLVAYPNGLLITFDDSFTTGQTFDVTISEVTTTPEIVPVMNCTVTGGSPAEIACASGLFHAEQFGGVVIADDKPSRLDIAVSSNGMKLAEKQFDVVFTTSEPNGPGCGTATSPTVTMSLK